MKRKSYLLLAMVSLTLAIAACTNIGKPSDKDTLVQPSATENRRDEREAQSRSVDDSLRTAKPEQEAVKPNQALGKQAQPRAAMSPPAKLSREKKDSGGHVAAAPTATGTVMGETDIRAAQVPLDVERYAHLDQNGIVQVSEHPVSTFSIDVDTAAYANVRRMLREGQLPQADAVRVEELINYFSYDYPLPQDKQVPFRVTTEIAPTPWNPNTHLLHIGIKGQDVAKQALPPANLVFLIDVSGSMSPAERLPMLKSALKMLAKQLRAQDRVAMVVYAGASGVVLQPTPGNETATIVAALDRLQAGGSTNGAAGIELAYAVAKQAYIPGGINRVLLATDGDFNVGTTSFEALKSLIEEKRKSGISLTTLGFGMGNYAGTRNYNDQLMEQLADAGNGNYAFIDTLNEAQKVLVEEMSSTLNTIAKDVKIQIEFNPDAVAEYRLIGYENRALKREDFSNDKVDAGEIGAGHSVTALYEIALRGSPEKGTSKGAALEPLRYQTQSKNDKPLANELAHLRLRYKEPEGNVSKLLEWPLERNQIQPDMARTSERLRFAAAVAGFGQLLKGGKYTSDFDYGDVAKLARGAKGEDRFGYRGEFLSLVKLAESLSTATPQSRHLSLQESAAQ